MNEGTSVVIKKADASEIVAGVSQLVKEAEVFQVIGPASHEISQRREQQILKAEKDLTARFEPSRKQAVDLASAIRSNRDSYRNPMTAARMIYGGKNTKYEMDKLKEAEEKERQLQIQAQKDEEDRKIREAKDAQDRGDMKEAEQIISEPIVAPVVKVEPEISRIKGSSIRKTYSCEVVRFLELAKWAIENPANIHALSPSMVFLNNIARAQREAFNIPGCKLVTSISRATRTKF